MGSQRTATYARGSRVRADGLNAMQDRSAVLRPASGTAPDALALTGREGRYWASPSTGIADGAVVVLDATRSWENARLSGRFIRLTAGNQRLGAGSAWKRNDLTQGIVVRTFDDAFTGVNAGAISAAPTLGSTVFAFPVDDVTGAGDCVWLFARTGDGFLCLLNDSGSTLYAELDVEGAFASQATAAEPVVPSRLADDAATTDATWTTLVTFSPPLSSRQTVTGTVSAIRDDGTEGGSWVLAFGVRRGASGAPAVGTVAFLLADADDADFGVRAQASGNDVVVQGRGDASKSLTWRAEFDVTEARIA